jgi:hypothetical protein
MDQVWLAFVSYTNEHVSIAVAAIEKYRGSETGEVGAAGWRGVGATATYAP